MNTTLMKLRREHGLTSRQLADEAGVELRIEYLCEIDGWVDEEDARKVINALSRLTDTYYSLETILPKIMQREVHDEPTLLLPIIQRGARTPS